MSDERADTLEQKTALAQGDTLSPATAPAGKKIGAWV